MDKKKVIIIGPAFPLRGGIANFNNLLAKAYQDLGHEVVVYSFSLQYPSFLFPGTSQYENGDAPNINIKTCINSINPINWFKAAKNISSEKADYVVVRYWLPFMAPCLGVISRLIRGKTKVIAITDNVIPHEKRIGDHLLTSFFVNSCDGFICLSKSVLSDLNKFTSSIHKKFFPHPIYNTFGNKLSKNKARQNLQLTKNGKYLLFFGFVREYKGLDLLLNALADKRLKKLGIKLIVAGEFYENKSKYLNLVKSLAIEDSVILKSSFISADEVKNYFCAADLITQTYKTATQSGITQIAYHFDRPMLVTDVGGLSEIVPHLKVGYVTKKDSLDIANCIYDFYNNDREDKFSENVQKEKIRFSWDKFILNTNELVDTI